MSTKVYWTCKTFHNLLVSSSDVTLTCSMRSMVFPFPAFITSCSVKVLLLHSLCLLFSVHFVSGINCVSGVFFVSSVRCRRSLCLMFVLCVCLVIRTEL